MFLIDLVGYVSCEHKRINVYRMKYLIYLLIFFFLYLLTMNARGRPRRQGVVHRNETARRRIAREDNVQHNEDRLLPPFRRPITVEINAHHAGLMDKECLHCHALHFREETVNNHFMSCCHNGLINLPQPRTNQGLKQIFVEDPQLFKNIRQYNSAMAFASLSANKKDVPGNGPYCFKIQGQIYRFISDLLPQNNEDPSYGQLYIIDTSKATDIRQRRIENSELKREVLLRLAEILSENPYAQIYKKASEEMIVHNNGDHELELRFVDNIHMDLRRYNKPTADEIAGVFNSTEGEPPTHRHVVVYHKQSGPKLLSVMSPHCDPMLYPLLFPYGEPGWDHQMTHNGPRRQRVREHLTMLQYACYRLAVRIGFSHLHSSKKLFQQYIVDMYTRVEAHRLMFIRSNQSQLRSEHYRGLQDFVLNRAQLDSATAGRIVVLPSSFEGSPRNMAQRYQDAMAIVQKYGKPDIFLTMTCNPQWPEILSALNETETPADRPDIVSRVFRVKLNELKKDLFKNNVFGVVIAHVYVIEFQKRGLPHCHMLLILENDSKFRDPIDIDRCVCAELPSAAEFPRLHEIVVRNMIHGPCGTTNPNSPCMREGKCTKKYPKEFLNETIENQNGYPNYRRRNDGNFARKGVYSVDNRDVVPYNPYLLLKYNAHINVEICSSVRSVKYLFKYVYKGYDSACMEFVQSVSEENPTIVYDETVRFTNMRYVSSHESIWRLHSNEMHEQSHTIIRLAVHEEGQHNVYFHEGNEEEALQAAEMKQTTLTAWFDLNNRVDHARQFLYTEIPQHYRFTSNTWIPRQRGGSKVIGRMYNVAPNDQVRFYLRMLLLHVRGATSFVDLRSYNNVVYDTYKEAAIARGLLHDDGEWQRCLEEQQNTNMPKQLRELFAYICCFCEPISPMTLWMNFKDKMIEDMYEIEVNAAENTALQHIDKILRENGLNCRNIGLPIPTDENVEINNPVYDINEQATIGEEMYNILNDEQKFVVDKILSAISGNSVEKLFFLEAPGGYGKTFIYSCLLHIIRGRGHSALASAWTGIAALLLEGGTTLHRLFGLPVPVQPESVSSIKINTEKAKLLRNCKIIIIDEASMVPAAAVDCIDRLLKDIMKCENPFNGHRPMGGKIILFGGDFRQVLPVVPMQGKVQILEACIQKSKTWKYLTFLKLRNNMRVNAGEKEFCNWLLQLGNGSLHSNRGVDIVDIPEKFMLRNQSMISFVFDTNINIDNVKTFSNNVIMCPLNEQCLAINNEILKIVEGEAKDYFSVDEIITDEPAERLNIPIEYLNSITPSGMPPHKLTIKVGAIVMLIRNMNLGSGLVNGVRLIVLALFEKCIKLEIITGSGKGNVIVLPRIKLISTDPNMPFNMTRKQFPIRLAFAITINKSQGQTFQKAGIHLTKPVFTHGQLYVAFSRAKSPDGVKLFIEKSTDQDNGTNSSYTKNIVYKEVLIH